MVDSISTQMRNLHGGKFRMKNINANYLIRLYDVKDTTKLYMEILEEIHTDYRA